MITLLWGTPERDLFATKKIAKRTIFLLNPEDHLLAVDTLSQTWKRDLAYAFTSLLSNSLGSEERKKQQGQGSNNSTSLN